ncbi:MAG: protein-glutamate O-methyltransferase CheR [Desulfobacterales bacterium]|jgi:chemotaxis protein methyltransferase CheR|nr:protein-glutamate O-methyltransferase CheR [Desulfobacterales bacterium]
MEYDTTDLKPQQVQRISELVYRAAGINLKQNKEALVRARLMKRLRCLGIHRVADYLDLIENDSGGEEIGCLIDVMTTNKTSFFREMEHFSFLRDSLLPQLTASRLRFWSAACSSGEEPYTLAIVLREHLAGIDARDVRILATDISRGVLEKARQAVYPQAVVQEAPLPQYRKYFVSANHGRSGVVRIAAEAQKLVRLAYLNLMEPWPMKGGFQVIFCRNVMIYFDRPTQQTLIQRFWDILEDGGYLFVGHSEGLSAIKHRFRYVRPAVYRK